MANDGSSGKVEIVWYPCEGVATEEWSPCQLLARTPGGGATLKIKKNTVNVQPELAQLICPRDGHERAGQNLASLSRDGLGPEGVEDAIRNHFCNQLPYTNINDVTLCVNPFRELPIYDQSWIEKYSALDPTLPPHIYDAAAKAYSRIMAKKQPQVIILLGEHGTGKSTSMKHLLHFMVQTAGDGDDLVHHLQALLRPFISVQCQSGKDRQWLSSRAMLSMEFGLDADGFICRTAASVRGLETLRMVRADDAEGLNFDALYLAMKEPAVEPFLAGKTDFRLLGEAVELDEYDPSGDRLQAWGEALETFDLVPGEVARALCGLVLLGELSFVQTGPGLSCEPAEVLKAAAGSLGVSPAALTAALAASGTPKAAESARAAALEDLYGRIVAWVVRAANTKMATGTPRPGHTITVAEVPTVPGELDRPKGVGALTLQWLAEVVQAELLPGALSGRPTGDDQGPVPLDDRSSRRAAAVAAVAALSGPSGLLHALRLARGLGAEEAANVLATSASAATGSRAVSVDGDQIIIAGAAGEVAYDLEELAAWCARGGKASEKLLTALSQSSCKTVADIAGNPAPPSALEDAEAAVAALTGALRSENSQRPWLVCCFRPNDKGSPSVISKPIMLRQVQDLRLAELVHLLGGGTPSIVWPLAAFRHRYAQLAPTLDASVADLQACQLLVRSVGGGQGTVGADHVFGEALLERIMETKLQELEHGARSEDQKKKEMEQLMNKKLQEAQQLQAQDQHAKEKEHQQLLEQMQKQQREQQQQLQQLQEQQLQQLQLQQQLELQRLQQEQERQKQKLEEEQQRPPELPQPSEAAAVQGLAGQVQPAGDPALAEDSLRKRPPRTRRPGKRSPGHQHGPGPVASDSAQDSSLLAGAVETASASGGQRPLLPIAGRPGPASRGMSKGRHAELHAALAQMAAVLRVAKEAEVRLQDGQESGSTQEVEDLRKECAAWRAESDRLWSQVKELRHLVEGRGRR